MAFSCSVPKDPTPDAHPYAKVVISKIDALNMGNSGSANVIGFVEAGSEVVKLQLKVEANTVAQYIYILKAADNGTMVPLPIPTTVNNYGTFTGGSSSTYSLKVPDLKSFTIDVAVSVRNTTTALNDVYKIWITSSLGSFSLPAYNRTLGSATINLIYTPSSLPFTFNTATVNLGSQSSKSYGSLLSTSGQVAAQDSALYVKSPESADIRLVTLTSGRKDNNSTSLWLYSPKDVTLANPAVSGQTDFVLPTTGTSRTTYFGTYTGANAFDDIDAYTLNNLPSPSNKSIEVVQDGVYVFLTQEGKKGLIRINSVGATTNFGGTGSTTAQNVGLSVKVLN